MNDTFLGAVIGAIVWTFANILYVDLRRKGTRKGRVISFFVGYPGTLISLFAVREGKVPPVEPPPDDEERLLREIRVDRELREERIGREPGRGTLEAPPGDEPGEG